MAELKDSALNYGHVGRPVYLKDTQSWSFLRSFTPAPPITYAGSVKTVISPEKNARRPLHGPHGRPLNPKSIPRAYPDLGVQWPSIREQKRSRFITAVTDIYDPHVSTLLDLGHALDLGEEDSNPIPVAAVVTGECRNTISLRLLVEDTSEVQFDGLEALLPTIGDTESAEWSTPGVPIRQVCFSQPAKNNEDKATWMAARLPESTTIFRPLYEWDLNPRYLHHYDSAVLPSTPPAPRLDANPVVEISSAHTGGFLHASVAFNPWHQRQVAILDMRGNWSLWKVQTRHNRREGNGIATPEQRSSLPSMDLESSSCIRHDGWGSILWIGDSFSILVADRRCVMVFHIQGDEIRSRSVELILGKSSEWVIDIQRSKRDMSQFFVLTTARVLWFDLTTASMDEEGLRLPLQHSLAWNHFRNHEDISMRLSELLIGQNSYIVLYSRTSELIQVYPCSFIGDARTVTAIGPDPFLLRMPPAEMMPAPNKRAPYSTFLFREAGHSPTVEKGNDALDMTLIKLYWIDSSYAVHETLFKGPSQSLLERVGMKIGTSTGNSRVPANNRPRIPKPHLDNPDDSHDDDDSTDDGSDLDDFIVEDWDKSEVLPRAKSQNDLPTSFPEDLDYTLSWARVYKRAVANIANRGTDLEGSRLTLERLITELKDETLGGADRWRNSKTMLEISGGRPACGDMDQTMDDLAHLSSIMSFGNPDTTHGPQFITLHLPSSSTFPQIPVTYQPKEISQEFWDTYGRLMKEWLSRLPHGIPNHTRLFKERIVRGVALDLVFSRLIQIKNNPKVIKPPQTTGTMIPVEGTPGIVSQDAGQELASSQLPSSQVTVTDNQDDHNSQDTAGDAISSKYPSLSAFTTFKPPFRGTRARSQNVANLLAHWEQGADPSTYDWEMISQAQSDMGKGELNKPRRKSRKKRPQPSQLSQRPQVTPRFDGTSLPPTPVAPIPRVWGSQPVQPFLMASSQPTVDGAPMTQTERGQFGTREAIKSNKTKKKRRAGGF
ncbi:hypothetical protein N7478_007308 [Penicillium angulare]|uniref:uncharacterized protein n=1 Tax=Penicillium angulare TaxID=116970 RepID=UPI00253FBFB9|nr:uncharacterized protein N7478_007308 [Penicillium angulare]KAJ5281936.1 hypothetical protein N7478_007308 [Penicillium angulare]